MVVSLYTGQPVAAPVIMHIDQYGDSTTLMVSWNGAKHAAANIVRTHSSSQWQVIDYHSSSQWQVIDYQSVFLCLDIDNKYQPFILLFFISLLIFHMFYIRSILR